MHCNASRGVLEINNGFAERGIAHLDQAIIFERLQFFCDFFFVHRKAFRQFIQLNALLQAHDV